MKELLRENGANNWLLLLGYKYYNSKKNYFNDKHESEENIAYQINLTKRYFELELPAQRLIQIPKSEYIKMCKEGVVFIGKGYKYKDEKNQTYSITPCSLQ